MANIPAEMQASNKVKFLMLGREMLVETIKELKAAGVGDVAIAGAAQGLGTAVAGAFGAYGAADAAAVATFKQDKRKK